MVRASITLVRINYTTARDHRKCTFILGTRSSPWIWGFSETHTDQESTIQNSGKLLAQKKPTFRGHSTRVRVWVVGTESVVGPHHWVGQQKSFFPWKTHPAGEAELIKILHTDSVETDIFLLEFKQPIVPNISLENDKMKNIREIHWLKCLCAGEDRSVPTHRAALCTG